MTVEGVSISDFNNWGKGGIPIYLFQKNLGPCPLLLRPACLSIFKILFSLPDYQACPFFILCPFH